MWHALICPPGRVNYTISDLGPVNFIMRQTIGFREDFVVTNTRGQKLQCSYFQSRQSQGKAHPCVIYLHGCSSSRLEGLSLIELLLPVDIALVLMDFAGCGISEGEYVSLGHFEREDASLVLDHIRREKPLITSFGVWGRSMGASTAVHLACARGDIQLVVADSAYTSIRQLVEDVGQREYSLPQFVLRLAYYYINKKVLKNGCFDLSECDTLRSLREGAHKPPIVFLAAKDDKLVNYSHSVILFDEYDGPKNIILFEGAHNTRRPSTVLQKVQALFRKHLIENYVTAAPLAASVQFSATQVHQRVQNSIYINEPQVPSFGAASAINLGAQVPQAPCPALGQFNNSHSEKCLKKEDDEDDAVSFDNRLAEQLSVDADDLELRKQYAALQKSARVFTKLLQQQESTSNQHNGYENVPDGEEDESIPDDNAQGIRHVQSLEMKKPQNNERQLQTDEIQA